MRYFGNTKKLKFNTVKILDDNCLRIEIFKL